MVLSDIDKLRADTPGCDHVTHFNNAGSALMPRPVLDAVVDHLELEASVGGYEAAEQCVDQLDAAYDDLAEFIGCGRSEVAFIENATRAWDMAFYSIPFERGDRILTAQAEYVSNYLAFLQMQQRRGVRVEVVPNDEYGQVSVTALERMLDDDVRLVAITHVPTNGGLVNPVEAIGRITREAGVIYLVDACQSAGQIPLDVERIGCDLLSATGRKFLRGPRGTGFLYVRRGRLESLEPPFVDLHSAEWVSVDEYRLRPDARRFENWETYVAGKLGLARAIRYASELGMDAVWSRVRHLGDALRAGLESVEGVTVTDAGEIRCGIVTFYVEGKVPGSVASTLRSQEVNVSVVTIGSARLDLESRGLPDLVRASVHYYNTEDEIAAVVRHVAAIASS